MYIPLVIEKCSKKEIKWRLLVKKNEEWSSNDLLLYNLILCTATSATEGSSEGLKARMQLLTGAKVTAVFIGPTADGHNLHNYCACDTDGSRLCVLFAKESDDYSADSYSLWLVYFATNRTFADLIRASKAWKANNYEAECIKGTHICAIVSTTLIETAGKLRKNQRRRVALRKMKWNMKKARKKWRWA